MSRQTNQEAPEIETVEQLRSRLLFNYWSLGQTDANWFDNHIEALVRAVHPKHPTGLLFPEEPTLPFGNIRAA